MALGNFLDRLNEMRPLSNATNLGKSETENFKYLDFISIIALFYSFVSFSSGGQVCILFKYLDFTSMRILALYILFKLMKLCYFTSLSLSLPPYICV